MLTNLGWPVEHSDAVKDLVARGWSGSMIMKEINRQFGSAYTRNAVVGKVSRMKLRLSGKPPGDPARFGLRKRKTKQPPRPPAKPLPVLPKLEPVSRRIRVIELEGDDCRWPDGDIDITFCGHVKLEGFPYCAFHQDRAVGDGTPSERRAAWYVCA